MSICNRVRDRGPDGRIVRERRRNLCTIARNRPLTWKKRHIARVFRHKNKNLCHDCVATVDADGIVFPRGYVFPNIYFW